MFDDRKCKSLMESLARETESAMQGVIGSLNQLSDEDLSQAQSAHVNRCLSSVRRVLRSLDDVTMLNRGPLTEVDFTHFSPEATVRRIVEVLAHSAQQRQVILELEATGASSLVWADAAAFEQIVSRTIEYAIHTVHEGVISVLILPGSGPIEDSVANIEVSISSPGWLLTQDPLTLRVARAFAARMGAAIRSVMTDAEGRIDITLPVRLTSTAGTESTPRISILVAEDCDDNYNLLSALLEEEPCRLSRAIDGEQAVAMATLEQYDIAFMDVNMPGLDGFEATQRIREWETSNCRKRMPIIVLSANNLETQVRQGATVGCSGYLEKPVPKATLVRTINRYVKELVF